MATSGARSGRRRWMLHEEVRSGAAVVEGESVVGEPGAVSARSYSFDAESVSFAVASKLLPQRLLAVWGLLVAGLALIAGLTFLDTRSTEVCRSLGIAALPAADWTSTASIGNWFSTSCLWMATVLCLLIYGLRRHRLDDYSGSYRRWLAAAALCAAANLMLSTGLHQAAAEALAAASGFTALPNHAVWWLVPVAIVGAWVVVRMALDMRPCRLGLFCLALSCGSYLAALVASFGAMPVNFGNVLSGSAALCAGHVWLVVALLAQVRFIRMEAAGQVALTEKAGETPSEQTMAFKQKPLKKVAEESNAWTPSVDTSAKELNVAIIPPKKLDRPEPVKKSLIAAAKGKTQWVDGRDARDSDREDEDERPLSKAERKRQRKEQTRRRAA